MIQESRKLAVLAAVALLIVGFSVLARVSRMRTSSIGESKQISSSESKQYTAPEPSFFETEKGHDSSNSSNNLAASSDKNVSISIPKKANNDPFLRITARAYLVGNVETGKIYFERNFAKQLPVASISKLVTAIIATETLASSSIIEITPSETMVPPDGSGIGAGERFTVKELLYPMLLDSSNIAAEAIASSRSNRMKFLELMSSYAWEVGMPQAYFADPSGIDPHNQASAKDIFALAQYLYKFRSDILAITRTLSLEVATTSEHGAHNFTNIHPFIDDARFIGGKTGRTKEAGETMLTILRINGQAIAFIIMGSENGAREGDTRILIEELAK
mgnify:FL=1